MNNFRLVGKHRCASVHALPVFAALSGNCHSNMTLSEMGISFKKFAASERVILLVLFQLVKVLYMPCYSNCKS